MNTRLKNKLSIIFPTKRDHELLSGLSVHDRIKYRYSVLKGRDSFNRDHLSANEKAKFRDHCAYWNISSLV